MKTKLTLLKKALLFTIGAFALVSCEKSMPGAMSFSHKDLAGEFELGTMNIRPVGTASAPYGGTMKIYTNMNFTIEDAGNNQLRFFSTNGEYSVDVIGTYSEKLDMMVYRADNVYYTHNGTQFFGKLYAKCKPNGFTFEIGNYTAGDPQQGHLMRYSTRYRVEPEPEVVE